MTPYLFRRHRRPLLFPPGLLALGFLLLLGCLALRPWYRVLPPHYVLTLTLPSQPVSDVIFPLPNNWIKIGESEHSSQRYVERYSQLSYFRPWQDFTFSGEQVAETTTAEKAQPAFEAMRTDTTRAKGIRIRFTNQGSYASLVQALGWAQSATGDNYLLDIHHTPVTLYAFTNAHRPPVIDINNFFPDANVITDCGICDDFYPPSPAPASVETQTQNCFTCWLQAWRGAFFSSTWQLPIALLLGIIAVSSWKMLRQWHTA